MAQQFATVTVNSVQHWNDDLFSFKTSRDPGLRFENGQFTMIGLEANGKPLMRAYSIASANYEEELEFFSIKVDHGALTSRLQHIQAGDELIISRKPTGTLIQQNLKPGKRLILLGTGTGLAPFLSIIKDPSVYDNYEQIIVAHGARYESELAYQTLIEQDLPNNEYFGEQVQQQLLYYPSLTREPYRHQGRLTDALDSGKMLAELGLGELNPEYDRLMLCGSPSMLKDAEAILNAKGFSESRGADLGEYAIERAFVER